MAQQLKMMENYRLLQNKKLILLLGLLVILNGVFFLYSQSRKEEVSIDPSARNEYLSGYRDYVESVIEGAGKVQDFSVFSSDENSFSVQDAARIADAYRRVENVSLQAGNDTPVIQLINDKAAGYVSLVMVLLIAFAQAREQQGGVSRILYASAQGRGILGFKRCISICVSAAVIHLVNLSVVLCLAVLDSGGGVGFGRSAQSIALFRDVTYPLSVSGLLFWYYLISAFAIALIGILLWTLASCILNRAVSALAAGVFLLLEYYWKGAITFQSSWKLLKCVNVLEYLDTGEYLFGYYNINCFGKAVNLLLVIKAGMALLFLIFSGTGILAFAKRPQNGGRVRSGKRSIRFRQIHRLQEIYNLKAAELYKMLIENRGIWVAALLLLVVAGIVKPRFMAYNETEQYVNRFYEEYSGKITDAVYDHLDAEHRRAEQIYEEYDRVYALYRDGKADKTEYYRAQGKLREAKITEDDLALIEAEISRAGELEKTRGIQIELVSSAGYDKLLGSAGERTMQRTAVAALLAIAVLMSGSFRCEESSRMRILLRSAARGREELFCAKETGAFAVTVFLVLLLNGVNIYYLAAQFGMERIFAPVQSIALMQDFPFPISILAYIAGMLVLRAGIFALIAELLLYLSVLADQRVLLLAFAGIVIVPVLTGQSGGAVMGAFSLFPLLDVNGIVIGTVGRAAEFVKLILILAAFFAVRAAARKKWCG